MGIEVYAHLKFGVTVPQNIFEDCEDPEDLLFDKMGISDLSYNERWEKCPASIFMAGTDGYWEYLIVMKDLGYESYFGEPTVVTHLDKPLGAEEFTNFLKKHDLLFGQEPAWILTGYMG